MRYARSPLAKSGGSSLHAECLPADCERKPLLTFCFHHAGGNAATFRDWTNGSRLVDFHPVVIRRFVPKGNPAGMFADASDRMALYVRDHLDGRPFALYGHSMGAAFAFEVCCRLESLGLAPDKLVVAGRQAPSRPEVAAYRSDMGLDALLDELEREGGTPREVLHDKDFAEYLLPLILDDYRLVEDYEYYGNRTSVPIAAHAATQDIDAPVGEVAYWEDATSGAFKLLVFEGDHFFVHKLGEAYLSTVEQELLTWPLPMRCC